MSKMYTKYLDEDEVTMFEDLFEKLGCDFHDNYHREDFVTDVGMLGANPDYVKLIDPEYLEGAELYCVFQIGDKTFKWNYIENSYGGVHLYYHDKGPIPCKEDKVEVVKYATRYTQI